MSQIQQSTNYTSQNQHSPKSPKPTYDDEEVMYVVTRTGRTELLDINQIIIRIQKLINRPPKLPHVNAYELTIAVCKGLKSGIFTYDIDEFAANLAASLSVGNPYYLKIAARIAIDNHQKNTNRSFVDKMRKAYLYTDKDGNISPLLDEKFFKYVEENQDYIESIIDYTRDFNLDFFGIRTFQRNYSIRINGKPIERPQDLFMRTAIDLNMNTITKDNKSTKLLEQELANIKITYDALSLKKYTHASPTYFNAGGTHKQYASCFLLGTGDSREAIMKTNSSSAKFIREITTDPFVLHDTEVSTITKSSDDMSQISKWAGGIGIHINEWRATGSRIRKTNGVSSGIVPFLKIYNDTMCAFNQGGRRPGSAAIYLMPHHPDIIKFIELRKNDGLETERARDLFYALWIPDLFMERVREKDPAKSLWSLFDPDRCGDLSNLSGDDYKRKYLELESKKMYTSQIDAKIIWQLAYETNKETGMPYICFSDNANKSFMQKNLGTVKSSNLCVAGDTLIMTDTGYYPIIDLANNNNGLHTIWNGFHWAEAKFAKTNTDQTLLAITFSDGVVLKCTPEHRFALWNGYGKPMEYIEARAKDLSVGDKLLKHKFPVIEKGLDDFKYPYSHGFFCGDGTIGYPNPDTPNCTYKAKQNSSYCGHHIKKNLPNVPRNANGICAASNQDVVYYIDLYHEKKDLLDYMDYTAYSESKEENKYRLVGHSDMADKFTVPLNYSKKIKLEWLSGYLDADGTIAKNGDAWALQVTSIEKDFLMQVKLLCNTLGTNPMMQLTRDKSQSLLPDGRGGKKLYNTKPQYRLCFSVEDSGVLYTIGLNTHRLKWNNKTLPMRSKKQYISISSIEKLETKEDTYCFNEPSVHMGIFNGVLAMNCAEIVLYSNADEYAICILSSIALPEFVIDTYTDEDLALPESERRLLNNEFPKNPKFDFTNLIDIVKLVVTNLNLIVDKTYHPVIETKRSSDRNRPIGVGVQGLDDCYAKMRFPFASAHARDLNKKIFECIYFAALSQSTKLCREEYKSLKEKCKLDGSVTIPHYQPDTYDVSTITYTLENLPKNVAAYPSMLFNGGSPISKGIFHWEMCNIAEETKEGTTYRPYKTSDLSGMFDWEPLREHIKTFGVKNSLLVALMPTASTSQLLGNNECFEPYTSNIYKRNTQVGEYIVVKKYLINELYSLGLWNTSMKDYLLACEGSIKYIDGIPDNIKELYPTVWEIDQLELVQQSIDRQPFVDQAQSLNLYVADMSLTKWNKLMFKAWRGGLKTGKYYLHNKPAAVPQKFTIDASKQKEMAALMEKNKYNVGFLEPLHEVCDVCSS